MQKTITQLNNDLKSGKVTVADLVNESKKIINDNKDVNAILGFYSDDFINKQIEKANQMFKDGTATDLTGIPIVLKDNILINGERAGAASKILDDYVAIYDATVVKKLRDAGAIMIARANMDEFAMGGSTENSAYGVVKNPKDKTRVAGGSSGGSAAVVAYGGVSISLGSDTGGSIRQPASLCGVVGLKPTYGSTSRYGLMAMGSSLDQIGPFGNSVKDVKIVHNIISGYDTLDSTSLREDERYKINDTRKKIGVPSKFVNMEGVDREVLENFNAPLEKYKKASYEIVDIDIKDIEKALSVYYVVVCAEVSSNMARYDGIRFGLSVPDTNVTKGYFKTRTEGLGDEVRRRILLGTYVLSSGYYDAYYNKANLVREMLKKEFAKVFAGVDVIATPTSPIPAFKIGEKSSDPLAMYLADIFTVPVNIVGVPAISIPSGKTKEGLPLGIQFIATHNGEETLFEYGEVFEGLN